MDQRPPEVGRTPARGGRFRWEERLHRKNDFDLVFRAGRRFSMSGLTMWVLVHGSGQETQKPRLGLAVSKTYGHAVARNRLKRLLRETFRLNKVKLPAGVDMVFSARPTLIKPQFKTIEPLVLKLWNLARLQP